MRSIPNMPVIARITLTALLCLHSLCAWSAQATVAVAANFAPTLTALAASLERQTGHHYRIASGATGSLYAQIKNGAPFDLFLAADQLAPQQIERAGLSVAGTRLTYATGQLVLWSSKPNRVDAQGAVLTSANLGKLAYANPKTAPYGAAAVAVLQRLGLRDALSQHMVQGESVGQTLSFIATGNADAGFVALSQVLEGGQLKSGSMWLVPQHLYPPIRQDAVLLRRGEHNAAALALLAALRSEAGKALIQAHGYQP